MNRVLDFHQEMYRDDHARYVSSGFANNTVLGLGLGVGVSSWDSEPEEDNLTLTEVAAINAVVESDTVPGLAPPAPPGLAPAAAPVPVVRPAPKTKVTKRSDVWTDDEDEEDTETPLPDRDARPDEHSPPARPQPVSRATTAVASGSRPRKYQPLQVFDDSDDEDFAP